jgi:hypothetical protein
MRNLKLSKTAGLIKQINRGGNEYRRQHQVKDGISTHLRAQFLAARERNT